MTWLLNAIGRRLKRLWWMLTGHCNCQSCGQLAPRCHLKLEWKNKDGEGTYEADLCPDCYHAKSRAFQRQWEELTKQAFGFNPFEETKR